MTRESAFWLLFYFCYMNILILLLAAIAVAPLILIMTGVLISGPRYKGSRSDHFDGSRFVNQGGVKAKGGLDVFRWMMFRKPARWKHDYTENYGKHPLAHVKDGIRITFINHSTFLIQVDGVNILTDPVWSKRASPYRWIGPKRKKLPGIRFEHLPRIHLVLLSHNHYDHLDLETMRMVYGAHHPKIVVPLGVKVFLDENYIAGSSELDWWQETSVGTLHIRSVPAQHFSGRGLLDRDATLWCGYVIKTTAGNVYFSGDTGYNEKTFRQIRSVCGPMKVSMLPIGAYKPGWFMSPIHVSPEESVMIHRDVESEFSIGMHFGTFPLADDGRDDPTGDLEAAKEKLQVSKDEFVALREGQFRVID